MSVYYYYYYYYWVFNLLCRLVTSRLQAPSLESCSVSAHQVSDLTDSGGFTGSCPLRGKSTRMATDLEKMENMEKSGNLKVISKNVFLPVMWYREYCNRHKININRVQNYCICSFQITVCWYLGVLASEGWWEAWQPSTRVTNSY